MATLNLGRIKPVFQGAYNNSTAYVVDDIVTFGDESFICIQASTGNATSNASYWTKLAAKGTDGTDVGTTITTQGDILYRDGSGLARLGYGTSGNVLTTKGSGQNPVWEPAVGGKLLQVVMGESGSAFNTTSSSYQATNLELNITPSATSSKILIMANFLLYNSSSSAEATIYSNGANIISSPDKICRINQNASYMPNSTINYLHSPNSTSQQNYKVYIRCSTGGTTGIHGDSAKSVIIAQEIGA